MQDYSRQNGKYSPNYIEPKEAYPFLAIDHQYKDFTQNSSIEYCIAPDGFYKYGDQENTQNGTVKKGADDVDQLDQVFKEIPHQGKCNGNDTPKQGKSFSCPYVMLFVPSAIETFV